MTATRNGPAHERARGDQRRLDTLTVVMATRDRRAAAVEALARLRSLPECPSVVVVVDGSTDGTAGVLSGRFPDVTVLTSRAAVGAAAARNAGVRAARTPFVAFADDDSWWAPGALSAAVRLLEAHPRLGLLAARIMVGDGQQVDATCAAMARSPLPAAGLPGSRVLGFVACGTVLRRAAFLEVGGFREEYGIYGEEEPLALALAAAGWDLAYVAGVVAHHAPAEVDRDVSARERNLTRNDLWTAWRYRRGLGAVRRTTAVVRRATTRARLLGIAAALPGLPRILAQRTPVPAEVEAQRRLLDRAAWPSTGPRGVPGSPVRVHPPEEARTGRGAGMRAREEPS